MKEHHSQNWFYIKPQAISWFLGSVIRSWGYPVSWNRSDDSESIYLTVYMDIHEPSKTLRIRVSDHSIPPKGALTPVTTIPSWQNSWDGQLFPNPYQDCPNNLSKWKSVCLYVFQVLRLRFG